MNHEMAQRTTARAFTLLELLLSLAVCAVLIGGIAASLELATRAMETSAAPDPHADASKAAELLLADIKLAKGFAQLTDTSVIFTAPDRDAPTDGIPETIRYSWSGLPGDPLLRQINDGPPVVVLSAVDDLVLSPRSRTVPHAVTVGPLIDPSTWGYFQTAMQDPTPRALLVVNDALHLNGEEDDRRKALEEWGFQVTPIAASASEAAFESAVEEADVAYIPAHIDEAALGAKLRLVSVGVVCEPVALAHEMGLLTGSGGVSIGRQIDIVDSTHYITTGYAGVTEVSDDQPLAKYSSNTGAARILAEADSAALCVFNPGDALQGGDAAPARRVFLPWGGADFDFSHLKAAGVALTSRSVEWASGRGDEGVLPRTFGYDAAFVTVLSNMKERDIATRVTLPETGAITSIAAYVNTTNRLVRFAIYSDDGGPNLRLGETSKAKGGTAPAWLNLPLITPTQLPPGDYWLVLAFDHEDQVAYTESGGQMRVSAKRKSVDDGFPSAFGTPASSPSRSAAIHAYYSPAAP